MPVKKFSLKGAPFELVPAEIGKRRLLAAVQDGAQDRRTQTARRLAWLEERWNDERFFAAIVASGRYLKFCWLLELAGDQHRRACLQSPGSTQSVANTRQH